MSHISQDHEQLKFALIGHVDLLGQSFPVFSKNKIEERLGAKFSSNLNILYPSFLFLNEIVSIQSTDNQTLPNTLVSSGNDLSLASSGIAKSVDEMASDVRSGEMGDIFFLSLKADTKNGSGYIIPLSNDVSSYAKCVKAAFTDYRSNYSSSPSIVSLLCNFNNSVIEEQLDPFLLEKLLLTSSRGGQVSEFFVRMLSDAKVSVSNT